MSTIYTETKPCKDCGVVKKIATFSELCTSCKIKGHDKIDTMIAAFCLGKIQEIR